MSEVTIKNLDGEVFVIDDFYTISIHLGEDNIEIPVIWKINAEKSANYGGIITSMMCWCRNCL